MSATELLRKHLVEHEKTIRLLTAQLAGVQRALAIAEAKRDAVKEAIESLEPPTP